MKRSKLFAVLWLISPLSLPSFAAEGQEAHARHHPEGQKTPATMSEMEMDKSMQNMQDSMLKMHELMNRILQAKDPQEIQRLKQEHLQLMNEHMQMMHEHMPMMPCMAKKSTTETKPGDLHETSPAHQDRQE